MPYVAHKPQRFPSSDQLRARIPGWGVDLDRAHRPAVPKENFIPGATGAHWDFPDRQVAAAPREHSIEHRFLPPVFGTSCPPKGLSGVIRRYAYRFSEARALHWLLLLGADRVDAIESRLQALLSGHPDSRILETGVMSELSHGGIRSRYGKHRADVGHQLIDAAAFAAPYIALGVGLYLLSGRRSRNRRGQRRSR